MSLSQTGTRGCQRPPFNPALVGNLLASATEPLPMPTTPMKISDAHMTPSEKADHYGPISEWSFLDTGDGSTLVLIEGFPSMQVVSARSGETHKISYDQAKGEYRCSCQGGKARGTDHWHMIYFNKVHMPLIMEYRKREWADAKVTGARPIETNALGSLSSERERWEAEYERLCQEAMAAQAHYKQVLTENAAVYNVPLGHRDPVAIDAARTKFLRAQELLNNARAERNAASEKIADLDRRISQIEALESKRGDKSNVISTGDFD